MTHTKSNIVQYNEYYPFGLQTNNSWTRENSSNNFLYNAGNELNQNSGWYETFFRGYDPAIGRFLQVDPMSFSEQATYQYAANNPVYYTDPLGAYAYGGGRTWKEQAMFLSNPSLASSVYGESGGGGMHRPGSGNHWADGWHYDDWVFGQGSETYRTGVAAGATDVGGLLYIFDRDGKHLWQKNENGTYGYYVSKTVTKTSYFAGGTQYKQTYSETETNWVSMNGPLEFSPPGRTPLSEYVIANAGRIAGLGVAGMNAYLGWQQIQASQALMLTAETGWGLGLALYLYTDGVWRIIGSVVNVVGIISKDDNLEKFPSNFLGIVGGLVDNSNKSFFNHNKKWGGTYQTLLQNAGDLVEGKRAATIALEKFITSSAVLDLLDVIYKSSKPWVDTFRDFINRE